MLASLAASALLAASPTVYISLPLHGASRPSTTATVKAAQQALTDAGSPLTLRVLDDSTAKAGGWTPERASANARKAVEDPNAVGYIGEFNSGASMVALPILNESGIAMISPANTADGLTVQSRETEPGEPFKYYPTGRHTYFRLVPRDGVQATSLAGAMRAAGCRRVASLSDKEIYGAGMGAMVRRGLPVVIKRRLDRRRSYRPLARSLRHQRVDCMVFTGITANGAVPLFRDVGRALPKAKLFGIEGIAENRFAQRIPRSVARRTQLTVSTPATGAYPAAGQAIINRFHDVYAAYGYEAMRLFVDAVAAAGPTRPAIVRFLHGVRDRPGVIGTYSFDAHGDTSLRTVGLYGIRGGQLTFERAITG